MRQSARMMSDYGCGWPVWLDDGGVVGDWFAVQHHLSPELCRDLIAVQEFFDERFHWDSGWRDAGDESRYADQLVDAFFRLGRELGAGWTVQLDLWPVTDEAILAPLRHKGILVAP